MSEIREGSAFDHPSKTFLGVRFVLFGFDPIQKVKVISKLVNGGGVDVGQYGPNCTHVIVDQLIYDDPTCVAARNDGKKLVTSLWVDHCFDVAMPINPFSIVYRPLKDLKGIPGAKSLIVCLTGYQRQDRDDIMTMVGLIGANFSRPLVASKVTHLICFKFEGEKYELAKKTKRIKLVNHRWLQDCLKTWEILPETDYYQSGYELEIMEAVVKDSEDMPDAIDTNYNGGEVTIPSICRKLISRQEVLMKPLYSCESKRSSNIGDANDNVSATAKETISHEAPNMHQIHNTNPNLLGSKSPKRSPCADESKKYAISYSRKKLKRTTPPMLTELSNVKSCNISSDEQAKPLGSRMFGKKFMRCRRSLDKGYTTDEKGSVYLNNSASQNDALTYSVDLKLISSKKLEIKKDDAGKSGNKVESMSVSNSKHDDESEFEVAAGKEHYTKVGSDSIGDGDCIMPSGNEEEEEEDATEQKSILCGKKITKGKRKSTRKYKKKMVTCVAKTTKAKSERNDKKYVAKTDPVLFILSGNRLERKEFQQIIRCLKGKVVCRDSHKWSYQATHFIATNPIRRTEKFCAAAASGRWILKSDYLTVSKQEGRFLAEEPYEWHQNGLSEDGAINLQAPRKWRLLREKTGHGAFYGMRVIIYGDCFVPPLDTLKRFVKAGDGTILATSSPYSRFLKSGVDFAIVSAGTPHGDIWVEEFIRHEIPCVVADYLVEYVCKPGYSLERHVQFNTHVWAEKSLTNMADRIEEISKDT